MSTLEGKPIADTYKDLLQISNNNSGADITLLPVEDGEGTQTALSLSTSMIGIAGHIIPSTNAAYDIGSAEYKIRHLFLSDNSLYVGDFQLSSSDVQEVKKLADGEYATTAQLTTQSDKVDTALQPGGVDFTTDLVNVPTTLDGYGIVDAATKLQGDLAEEAAAKANTALQPGGVSFTSDITNIPTTLAGYGITEITLPEQKLEQNNTIVRRQSFDLGAFKRRVHVQLDNNTSMKVSICCQRDGVDNSLLIWDGYINNNYNTSYCTEVKSVRTNGTNSAYTFSKTDAIENEPCNFYWDFNESPEVGNGVIIVEAIKGDCIISISDHDQIIDMTDSSYTGDSSTGDSGTGDSGTGDSGTGDISSNATVQNLQNSTGLSLTQDNHITGTDWIDTLSVTPVVDYTALTTNQISMPMDTPAFNMNDYTGFGMSTGGEYYVIIDTGFDVNTSKTLYFDPDTGLSQMLILQEGYGVMFFNESGSMDASYGDITTYINVNSDSSNFMKPDPVSDAIEIEEDEFASGAYTSILAISLNVNSSVQDIIQGIEDSYVAQMSTYRWGYVVVQYNTA